jgi:Cu/Ag efflux protein CusF
MKKLAILMLVALLAAGAATLLMGQEPKAPAKPAAGAKVTRAEKPGGVVVQEVQATAVVKAIDQEKRLVTLSLPSGETETFTAGPEIRNLAQVKVGDKVTATYVRSLAILVRGSKEPPSAENATTVKLAAKGAKPGAYIANTQTLTAKVTAIDHKTRVVTLTGPKGNSLTFEVGPDVQNLDKVKKGDEVVVSYTESLLVDVVGEMYQAPTATKTEPKKSPTK